MAPQAAPTSSSSTTTDGNSSSGLTQAQLGGILGGVGAFVVLLVLIWYAVTHSESYLVYRNERHHRQRAHRARQRYYRQQWQRRRRSSIYEGRVSYSDSETGSNYSGMAEVRRARHLAALQAMAVQQAQQEEAERAARAAAVATSPPYVLNPPPVRFPPTTRRAIYRQTAYPQIPGVRRTP
ncbi:hypothetical protein SBRCBS47491_005686 [Sporothrix bragantina]|uniref:Transmembrane protein n=1 Tax=Sporothrix bragantina TaxID=671064 RepID=A0ABP0BYR1_9PEZI